MSRFFQQLMARQQGQADTVKPLIAPRFSQPASAVFAADGLAEPVQPLHSLATGTSANVQSNVRFDTLTDTSLPTVPTFSNRVEQPAAPLPADWRELSASSPTDMAARLAQVSQWMGELATVVDGSQRDRIETSIETSTQTSAPAQAASAADELAQLQTSDLSSQESHRSDIQSSEPRTAKLLSTPPLAESLGAIASPNPTFAQPPTSAPNSADKKSRPAESAIQPFTHRLQPVSPNSLQPILQSSPLPSAPPPAPTIQVAIGRIEIRATTPAKPTAQPRRVLTSKRAALSLDQYLQRRSGEG